MSSQPLVLVTGVSGFLGAHVIDEALKQGYRVRGTVRSPKLAAQRKAYASYGNRVDIVGVDEVIAGDFSAALQGVDALIHVASPMPGRADPQGTINGAVEGTLNVLRQAQKAGIKNISVTSSIAAVVNLSGPFKSSYTEKDWNPATKEEALTSKNPLFTYSASKALAEKALWEFVDHHPELNVTTVNPSFLIGPFASKNILEKGNTAGFSTNLFIYNILLPDSKSGPGHPLGYVDVRDVAAALVGGIKVQGKNRVLLTGEWFDHKQALDYIAQVRPELKDRLPTLPSSTQTDALYKSGAVEILGVPPVRPWKESVLATVDAVIEVEKDWAENGVDIDAVLHKNSYRGA